MSNRWSKDGDVSAGKPAKKIIFYRDTKNDRINYRIYYQDGTESLLDWTFWPADVPTAEVRKAVKSIFGKNIILAAGKGAGEGPRTLGVKYTEQDEKKLILDVLGWPNFPILPVKNYKLSEPGDQLSKLGVVFANSIEADKPVIYIANMWMLAAGTVKLSELEKIEYESVDAMLVAGWVGD